MSPELNISILGDNLEEGDKAMMLSYRKRSP